MEVNEKKTQEHVVGPVALSRTTKSLTYLYLKDQRDDVFDHYAIRTPEWKYLHSEDGQSHQLYDLVRDPGELTDVATQHPEEVEQMRQLLSLALADRQLDTGAFLEPPNDEDREALEERLRSLGYIN